MSDTTNDPRPGFPNLVPRENWDKGHEQPPIGDVRGTPAYLGYPNDTKAATAPLLSGWPFDSPKSPEREIGASLATKWYEARIASGELMVVKTTTLVASKYGGVDCSACGRNYPNPGVDPESLDVGEFCRCGAKITEG